MRWPLVPQARAHAHTREHASGRPCHFASACVLVMWSPCPCVSVSECLCVCLGLSLFCRLVSRRCFSRSQPSQQGHPLVLALAHGLLLHLLLPCSCPCALVPGSCDLMTRVLARLDTQGRVTVTAGTPSASSGHRAFIAAGMPAGLPCTSQARHRL